MWSFFLHSLINLATFNIESYRPILEISMHKRDTSGVSKRPYRSAEIQTEISLGLLFSVEFLFWSALCWSAQQLAVQVQKELTSGAENNDQNKIGDGH